MWLRGVGLCYGENFGWTARGGFLVFAATLVVSSRTTDSRDAAKSADLPLRCRLHLAACALVALVAEFLDLVEADDGAVELALDGGGVAHHQGEFLAGLLGGFEAEGDFGEIAFAASDAPQTPESCGDVVDQLELEGADGLGFLEEVFEQRVVFGLVLIGQNDTAAGEPMLERVQRRALLAGGGPRTGPFGDDATGFE